MPESFPLIPQVAEEFDFPGALPAAVQVEEETEPATMGPLPMIPQTPPGLDTVPDAALALLSLPGSQEDVERSLPLLGDVLAGMPTPSTAPPVAPEAPPPTQTEQVRADSIAFRDLGRRRTELVTAVGGLDARIASAPPDEKAALIADRNTLVSSLGEVDQAKTEARDRQDLGMAELQEQAQVTQADASLAAAEAMAAESERIAKASAARTEELARREDRARSEAEEATGRYQSLLRGGPQEQIVGSTLADIFSETLQASVDNRVPNFAAITDRSWKRNQGKFAADRDAAAAAVELTGDRVADLAAQRRAVIAEDEIQRAAVLREVTAQAQLEIQRATTPLAQAQAADVYRGLQEQSEAADARAAQARVQALERADAAAMKRSLDAAKLGKLQAETGAIQAKAAKLAGRGGSGKRGQGSGMLPPAIRAAVGRGELTKKEGAKVFNQAIYDPATGEPLKRADGTFAIASDGKTANVLNEAVARVSTANGLVNEALAMRGAKGWEPTTSFYASEAGQRMKSLSSELLLLNKNQYELGVLSGSDEAILKRIQGGDLEGMLDPRPALRDFQRRQADALNVRLKSLVPGAPALTFKRTTAAPRPTVSGLATRMTQAPRLGSKKIVPTARERMADVEQLRELMISEAGGDIGAAAQAFTKQMGTIIKRGEAHGNQLLAEVRKAEPAGLNAALFAVISTSARLGGLRGDPEATGVELEEASRAVEQAQADVKKLETPRFTRLVDAAEEQRIYVKRAKEMVGRDDTALREREARARGKAEQATERFEAGRVISAGKLGS